MMLKLRRMGVLGLAGVLGMGSAASAGLVNAGFEAGDASGGDLAGAAGWSGFNAHFTTRQAARTGVQSLKLFGPFVPFGGAGALQGIDVAPGEEIEASAWAFDAGSADPDGFQGANFALVQLRFLDSSGGSLGVLDSPRIDASAPDQQWIFLSVSAVAPAGATRAEIILLHVQLNDPVTGGAVFFDDASLGVIPEPAAGLAMAGWVPLMLRRRR